ncbi:MAG: SCP2 sterol-binding domain-containing protein [Nitratireductor sp.]|nr:SCP2 sterol-binding domain-containing protein [Nitratireductor sp.]
MSIETAADAIRSKVSSGGLDSTVKFDCGSDGVIFVDGSEVVTEDKAADCTIKLSLDTLEGLIDGSENATGAFMMGKIKVEGDMGVAMKLSQVL